VKDNFESSLKHLLAHEGGWSDHPADPGGATMKGVTLQVFREFKRNPHITKEELRNISDEDLATIYKKRYWDAVRADELLSGVDYAVFDCAVNSGPGRAIKVLQACVGTTPDGGFGSVTMAAVAQFQGDVAKTLVKEYCEKRLDFLKSLKTFEVFGKGWERRVNEVEKTALEMLG
jgi:lysozyme family protein